MSVNVGDRKLSKIEVLYQADKLQEEIIALCLRSFGLYSKSSPMRMKYSRAVKLDDNPEFLMDTIKSKREMLLMWADNIVISLAAANAIFPRNSEEFSLRLSYQNEALATCSMIDKELNVIAKAFDVDINVFKDAIKILKYEQHLIKQWRKSDKARFSRYLL